MENEEVKRLGSLGTVSKCAGAGLGTVAKVGSIVKNSLTRPVDNLVLVTDEQTEATPQTLALEPEIENTASGEDELVSQVTALEFDIAEVRSRLAEAQNQVGQMQSEFASQLSELQAEKDSLIFDLEQTTKEVNHLKSTETTLRARIAALESEPGAAKGKSEKPRSPLIHAIPLLSEVGISQTEPEVLLSEQQDETVVSAEEKAEPFREVTTAENKDEAEISSSVPVDVTIEEVNAANFDSATEKVIFIKALSDISNHYKAIRVETVKTMAGIDHELSVRALVGQMAKEPVAQVRTECIKALAELNMKEGLPAIENALSEQAVSVRLAAVRGLYRLGGLTSAPQLIRMLCDENKEVRRRTATCIGWLGREELAVELVPLLDDSSVSVRRSAIEAMGNLHSRNVVAELIIHLTDPEKMIRKTIIAVLETITGKKMSGPFPVTEKSVLRLVARWQQWWKDEHEASCQT